MIKYGVFTEDVVLITHKIHRTPKETYFPAIFDDLEEAKDYANGIGVVRKITIKTNKRILK